jgi:DNA-directed RNA polymerase subunit RPC12/RpoP
VNMKKAPSKPCTYCGSRADTTMLLASVPWETVPACEECNYAIMIAQLFCSKMGNSGILTILTRRTM